MDEAQTLDSIARSELDARMSQLSVGNAIEDGSSTHSMMSAFERLPGELFREIVQYAPESVFDLRLTSRAACRQVDAFAITSANVQIVDLVMIKVEASTTITLGVRVPETKSKLFELRLRLEYKIECNLLKDAKLLQSLIDCCGHRIGTLLLINFGDIETFISLSKMLEQTRIRNLCCEISQLHDPIATLLLSVIRLNMVQRIALTVRDNFCADPAAVLVEMASHVRAIRIVGEGDRSESPFTVFGIIEWAPVILAIFSVRFPLFTTRYEKVTRKNERNGQKSRKWDLPIT
ncbi:hypothetical protein PRIPAC_79645 [Pristionchus pacificus]|uniref:Uncharacterized protein n=1 Tax=Pristionchus pacificus TaxID=54126 RepID=A0A2A6BHX7_PRIPA|nr:hypothetical protein PRIPAC_79645 [Pristionchus pacificus]|eukprot:PDM65477.1 hypothetical protein PRIPAC_52419 [Pristionchus pacificus]